MTSNCSLAVAICGHKLCTACAVAALLDLCSLDSEAAPYMQAPWLAGPV